MDTAKNYHFQTLNPAIRAYLKYQKAKKLAAIDSDKADADNDSSAREEPAG